MRWGDRVCRQCGGGAHASYPEIACAHLSLLLDQISRPFDSLGNGFDDGLTVAVYAVRVGSQQPVGITKRRASLSGKGLPR
jgi:hypothetical protein